MVCNGEPCAGAAYEPTQGSEGHWPNAAQKLHDYIVDGIGTSFACFYRHSEEKLPDDVKCNRRIRVGTRIFFRGNSNDSQ